VANAINEFLRSERVVQQAAPGIESPFEQIEREVVVVPEPISNSLILSSTPRFFDEIEQLINKLDEEPPQVMIQVLIAEVKLDNAHEFGIETGLQDSVLFDRSLLGNLVTTTNTQQFSTPSGILTATDETIQAATNTPGYDFNNPAAGLPNSASERSLDTSSSIAPQSLTNFSMGRINNELGFGGLVLAASSESVSLLIRALQETRRAEILSRPQIRTLDNQPAYIQIGERVPRVIQSTITTGGTITNSIDLENVGLILGVTPRISPDGMVVMEVDAEKSELGADSEGVPISISATGNIIRAPIVRTTVAQATVSALDGETIVLGGLISKTTTSVERKVPYLADIPLVGQLFRYDSEMKEKKELLIILTPYVIRSPEDGDKIKQLETSRISWCCADVHAIHGVAGLCNVTDCPTCAAEIPALYPDFDPRGIRPNATP
jgi:type II secretory pathway component GspD/PulD (secretin)